MSGKTVLITGGNAGLGYECARQLAQQGCRVVLLCRSREKGEAAAKAIREATRSETVEVLTCDISLMADVRRAAEEFKRTHDRLDVLVNNAGVFLNEREVTSEGLERTFATNYLGHFLLTHLLLDLLKASAPARIVNVATLTRGLKIDFDDLMLERGYSLINGMGRTKLALILMTQALSKRLEGTGVTVNALHPGVVKTAILDGAPWYVRLMMKFAGDVSKGARTHVYLASSAEVANVSGKLFADCKPVTISGQAADPANAERLYELSLKLAGVEALRSAA